MNIDTESIVVILALLPLSKPSLQQRDHVLVAIPRRQMQRRPSPTLARRHVDALHPVQQQRDHVLVASLRRPTPPHLPLPYHYLTLQHDPFFLIIRPPPPPPPLLPYPTPSRPLPR